MCKCINLNMMYGNAAIRSVLHPNKIPISEFKSLPCQKLVEDFLENIVMHSNSSGTKLHPSSVVNESDRKGNLNDLARDLNLP